MWESSQVIDINSKPENWHVFEDLTYKHVG